jgi:hypothetical protein
MAQNTTEQIIESLKRLASTADGKLVVALIEKMNAKLNDDPECEEYLVEGAQAMDAWGEYAMEAVFAARRRRADQALHYTRKAVVARLSFNF